MCLVLMQFSKSVFYFGRLSATHSAPHPGDVKLLLSCFCQTYFMQQLCRHNSFLAENFSSAIRNNNSYILTSFYLLRHYLRHLLRHTLYHKIFQMPFLFEPNLSIIPFSFISFNNRCTCLSDISNFSAAPFAEIFLSFSNICNSLS